MAPFTCNGNGADHCCYVNGQPCAHLEENTTPGRRWTCGLLRRLGTWEKVHASPEYQANPKPTWKAHGVADCGDFRPQPGQCCTRTA